MVPNRAPGGRVAVLMLGSHRSGAADLADVLTLAGVARAKGQAAGSDAPDAATPIAGFSDRVLQQLDSGWSDLFGPRRPGSRLPIDTAWVEEARGLIRSEYDGAALILLDEPRIAHLAELWKAALREEGYQLAFVVPVREPLQVAAALKSREGLTRNRALLLWTSYMLAAERASRGERRVFLSLEGLAADAEGVLDRLERKLALRLPRRTWDNAAEIEERLRVSAPLPAAPPATTLTGPLSPIRKLFDHLHAAAGDAPENEDVTAEVEAWFGDLEHALAPVLKQLERETHALAARHQAVDALSAEARQQRDALADRAGLLEAANAQLSAERDHAREAEAEALRRLGEQPVRPLEHEPRMLELEQALAGRQARCGELEGAVERLENTVAQLRADAGDARTEAAEAARAAALEAQQQMSEAFGYVRDLSERLEQTRAQAEAKAAGLEAEAAALGAELAEARRHAAGEEERTSARIAAADAAAQEEMAGLRRAIGDVEAELRQERAGRADDAAAAERATLRAEEASRETQRVSALLEEAQAERDRARMTEEGRGVELQRERDAAQELRDAFATLKRGSEEAQARATVVESALAVSRRRAAEAETLLQQRLAAAQAEVREAHALAEQAVQRSEREGHAREAALQRDVEDRRQAMEAEASARIAEERGRYAEEDTALRDRLAETGVAAAAAQTRARELQARLDAAEAELERRRGWLARLFGHS